MGLPVSSYCSVCASDISATVQTLNLRTVVWVGGGAGCQRSNQEHLAQNLCPRAVRKLSRCAAPLNTSKGACEGKWTSCGVLFAVCRVRSSQCSRALMNSGKVSQWQPPFPHEHLLSLQVVQVWTCRGLGNFEGSTNTHVFYPCFPDFLWEPQGSFSSSSQRSNSHSLVSLGDLHGYLGKVI